MQATAVPIQQNQRTAIVDMLRGWALLGVVLMNYIDYFYIGLDQAYKPDTTARVLEMTGNIFFAAKSWTMLSMLFGYGFAVLMQNIAAKGLQPVTFFTRRMFWLLMLAIINSMFFFGDILKDYAILGMVLLLLHRLSAKAALITSIGLFLIAGPLVSAYLFRLKVPGSMELLEPHLPLLYSNNPVKVLWFGLVGTYKYEMAAMGYLVTVHINMLGCFLLGLAAQKVDFFNRLKENKKALKWIFFSTLLLSIAFPLYFIYISKPTWTIYKYYRFGFINIIFAMLFIASSLCWLYVSGKLKAFFENMQVIGKMTLTNYMMQNALALLLFSGFGLGLAQHKVHVGWYLLFALVIYIAQIYFSKWWLQRYRYGPVEWVWRQLSYHKRLPLKKEVAPVKDIELALNAG